MRRKLPFIVGWSVALVASLGFAQLGRWQVGRAVQKEAMLVASSEVVQARRAVPLVRAADPTRARAYDWTQAEGRFEPRVLWLDNQQRGGRVGLRAFVPFRGADGTHLLVDAGWWPWGADRRALPRVELPSGTVGVRGLLAPPPSPGIAMGAPLAQRSDGVLMTRVDLQAAGDAVGSPLAPRVLRLDPALPFGGARDLELLANTLSPDKHRGYALQWFGIAATVLVIAAVLTFRSLRR